MESPDFAVGKNGENSAQNIMRVIKVIVDTDNERIYTSTVVDVNNSIGGTYNIREVWISDKVDAMRFILSIFSQMRFDLDPDTGIYRMSRSTLFHSQRATIFVPESTAEAIIQRISRPAWSNPMAFTLKTYSGDVYSVQKAGAEAAKPICTAHAVATRQEAAAVIYRALRFIEESGPYSYTEFTSGLDKYSDASSILKILS